MSDHENLLAARQKLAGLNDSALTASLDALFANEPGQNIAFFTPDDLIDIAQTHLKLAEKRKAGRPALTVRTPGALTVVDVVNDDMAFIVNSLSAEINREHHLIRHIFHPILKLSAEEEKKKANSQAPRPGYRSHIHITLQDTLTSAECREMEAALLERLQDVRLANRDWKPMHACMAEIRDRLPQTAPHASDHAKAENAAFLDYLVADNFTLLGYTRFTIKDGKPRHHKSESLGLFSPDRETPLIDYAAENLPRAPIKATLSKRTATRLISLSKLDCRSPVHRPVPMDVISINEFAPDGTITAEHVFTGLFTSGNYARSIEQIPLLRDRMDRVLRYAGFSPNGHNERALRHILERYPRDEMFQIDSETLHKTVVRIMQLQEEQKVALFLRENPYGRTVSCLVYVPRNNYETRLRLTFQRILETGLEGCCTNFFTTIDDSLFARVMFTIDRGDNAGKPIARAGLETALQKAGRAWVDRLCAALSDAGEERKRTAEIRATYGDAFPVAYRERYTPEETVRDIRRIEEACLNGGYAPDLYIPPEDEDPNGNRLRLKIFHCGASLTLSDVLPTLENLGLRVISELPFEICPAGRDTKVWIHDFLMERTETCPQGRCLPLSEIKDVFEEALIKLRTGWLENDGLNRLIIGAGMDWREISILRMYVRYLRQARYPYSRSYVETALTANPKISRHIVELFKGFFDPANGADAEIKAAGCSVAIDHALENVDSLDQDRILRSMTALVEATLRTNFYQRGADGEIKPCLAIKLESPKIEDLPAPKPFREIFVYSPRVEGVHLRGGPIARGGLRWSDRHEDFRTEVLGLMKAQMVKNAVIVPHGAKGGFVCKHPVSGRDAWRAEGIACYRLFVSSLLDLTDNRKGGKVVPPKDVVRRDGDDPYLVVAADKGTATFSDIANEISEQYDFWLGDAFASGGSAGYDHKKMGITAKGAWESVKRHFREIGHDTQSQPFDVIGVGDMSGDVFGNGMLLSEHIRMIGAFNHLHIVCDPNPDPAVSFAERKRLFDEVKGWDAYDEAKLSEGGRIFSRQDKSLQLTPEIRKRFEIPCERVTPYELIRHMLKARTDLLWFGGIGTYIKSSRESHADVGDKANDPLRLNASEIRARVIGEGANLAITQLGRIEFSEKGGRVNADYIDNSGGVDSSDHEVNIKILLGEIAASRKNKDELNRTQRNRLLAKMTDEVAGLVLTNNYQQAQAISLMEIQAPETLQIQAEFISDLEHAHNVNRVLEGLPNQETIENRQRLGRGLTRPELSVLQAYAKITLTDDLLQSDIPDSPELDDWLQSYFPGPLRKNYADEIRKHRLHREIVATGLGNHIVNRMGPTFVKSRMLKTGANCAEVARAYLIVREAFGLQAVYDKIEALDGQIPALVQLRAMRDVSLLAERGVTWFLTRLGRHLDIHADIKAYREGIGALRAQLDTLVTKELGEMIGARRKDAINDGVPETLAHDVSLMPVMGSACDIVKISVEDKTDLPTTAKIYFELGEYFHLDWLRRQARFMHSEEHWTAEALENLIDQLYSSQAGITTRVLHDMPVKQVEDGREVVKSWIAEHAHQGAQIESLFHEFRRTGNIDLPMLVIAEQRLRNLYGG